MSDNQGRRTGWVVMLIFLCGTVVAGAQDFSHDLTPLRTAFENYNKDFHAMAGPLRGEDWQVVQELENISLVAEDRIFAASAGLRMYKSVSCEKDRARVRGILKEQLEAYSWLFDKEVTRTAGLLTFAKVPAAAQLGLRMKDDLRVAREKLDAIVAALK